MSFARACVAGLASLFYAGCTAAAPGSSAADPVQQARDVVEAIYAPYLHHEPDAGASLATAAPWTNELKARIAELELIENQTDMAWGPEFDPIIESQEDFIADVEVARPTISEDGIATVQVHFNNGGDVVQEYELIQEAGAWRVSNIRSAEWELDGLVRQAIERGRAHELCTRSRLAADC